MATAVIEEHVVFQAEKLPPTQVTVKQGRCEVLMRNNYIERIVAVENFVPLKRIIDLFNGFDKLEIVDQQTPDNLIESGRYLVRATKGNEVIRGYCDHFAELGLE